MMEITQDNEISYWEADTRQKLDQELIDFDYVVADIQLDETLSKTSIDRLVSTMKKGGTLILASL